MKVKTDKEVFICGHGYGTPAVKNLFDYCETRYNSKATNGKTKGLVCVRRHKQLGKNTLKRYAFKRTYKKILGRNIYSQTYREYVYTPMNGKYYSDCSSSGMATLIKLGYKLPWLFNTAAIMESTLFETVPVIIKQGHIMNPEILKVGDCLMFRGDDTTRPQQVGHVEYVWGKKK